jgi:hypothetical protein
MMVNTNIYRDNPGLRPGLGRLGGVWDTLQAWDDKISSWLAPLGITSGTPSAASTRVVSVVDPTAYPFYCDFLGGEWLGGDKCKVKDGTIDMQVAISKQENEYVCRNLTGDDLETCLAHAADSTRRTQNTLEADKRRLMASGDPDIASSYCQAEAAMKYPTLSKVIGPGNICDLAGDDEGGIMDNFHWILAGAAVGLGALVYMAAKK